MRSTGFEEYSPAGCHAIQRGARIGFCDFAFELRKRPRAAAEHSRGQIPLPVSNGDTRLPLETAAASVAPKSARFLVASDVLRAASRLREVGWNSEC